MKVNSTPTLLVTFNRPEHTPNRIKMDDMAAIAQSIPYNPLIAKGFYYRELFENWGRGHPIDGG